MSDVDLIISVHTTGAKDIANLSASVRNLALGIKGVTVPMRALDTHTRAVNKALGITNRGVAQHANSLKELKKNQAALSEESKRLRSNIQSYNSAILKAGGPTTKLGQELSKAQNDLKSFSNTFRGLRIRSFGSDLSNISLKLQKMGKDFQFVGRSLMINLTAPITLFGRLGLQSLAKVDGALVRLTKVLEDVAMDAEQANSKLGGIGDPQRVEKMIAAFNALDRSLTGVSNKFGVSKDLVVSIASDFAELGITASENIIELTTLTASLEKLGSMDISAAQDLTQALYFQSKRALTASGALDKLSTSAERETRAIAAATTQAYLFNSIENATALTLKDIAETLPELGGMAVSFGLSMTEAAALLAPMKAAGLDVGASANSIKVSLQRAISPTKQNVELIASLAQKYGVADDATSAFNKTTKTGLTGLQAIVDIFGEVRNSAAGQEGALKLMSDLFEKRQGPRMYIAIEQLNQFDKALSNLSATGAGTSERILASVAETAIKGFNELNGTALPETIRQFSDIGIIARIATATVGQVVEGFKGAGLKGVITEAEIKTAREARKAVSDLILTKQQNEGINLIDGAQTEAAKTMLVELAGASNAGEVANRELEQSLRALDVTIGRIKNAFKLFAGDLMKVLKPTLEAIADKITELYDKWEKLSAETKKNISRIVVFVLGFLAVLGPVVLALGTVQASMGVLGRAFTVFLPKLLKNSDGFIGLGESASIAKTKINDLYKTVVESNLNRSLLRLGDADSADALATKLIPDPPKLIPTPAPPPLLPSSVKTGGDLDRLVRLEQRRMLSHLDPTDVGIARGTLRGPGGKFLPMTPGAKTARAMMLPGGGADLAAAEASLFARLKAQQATLHAKKLADIATQNAAMMAGAEKEAALRRAGIGSRTTPGGITQRTYRGMDVTDTQAGNLAAKRSPILRTKLAVQRFRETLPTSKPVNMGKGFVEALRPIQQFKSGMAGAGAATDALRAKNALLGASAPGQFKTMATAIGGFTRNVKLATLAMKIMRLVMVSTGIGVIILGIGLAIMLVVKNFTTFKEKSSGAINSVKQAFKTFMSALKEIARPILDLFKSFDDGGAKGKSAIGGLSKAFGGIAKAISFVADLFKKFVLNFIQPYLYYIVNLVMVVVSIFQGNWGNALDFLISAFSHVGKIIVVIMKFAFKALVAVAALAIKGILTSITLIPKTLAKAAGFLGKFIPGFTAISEGINSVIDGMFGMVDSAKNLAMGAIDGVADAIGSKLESGAKKGISNTKEAVDLGGKKIVDSGEEIGYDTGEAIANAAGDGYDDNDPSEKIGKALKDGIADAVQELQDYVAGELKNAIDKYVNASIKALEKQKASALKVFDVQLKTLMKLEKAEESLTKTKEYEANKRKLIDDKALSDEQYRRNYALAVYEGRIDDARMLQLEQSASEKNYSENLKGIESDRAKDLAKENLEALKEAINEAKDAASVFFDEAIEKFQESIEVITKFPPVTIEDYRNQIGQLYTITSDTAAANSEAFEKMFTDFATTVNDKMPNDVIGAFTTNLDDLVRVAREKYGLGGEAGEDTIIGATIGMLADIGGTFGDGKQVVIDKFGEVTTGFKDNFAAASTAIVKSVTDDFLTPFAEATTTFRENWNNVYVQAIKDGNQAITDSLRNNVKINKELFEEMRGKLTETTLSWLNLKAAAEAAGDAQAAAAAGGGGVSDTPGPKGSVTPAGGRADAFENNNRARVDKGLPPISYQEFISGTGRSTSQLQIIRNPIRQFAKGGMVPSGSVNQNFGFPEGYIPSPRQEGVPTLLHGGEYILNAKAVSRIGIGALNKMNNNLLPKFAKGGVVPGGKRGSASNTRGSADRLEASSIVAAQVRKAASEAAGLPKNFIGPIVPPKMNSKKNIFQKAGGFVGGSVVDLGQSFSKFGDSVWNIASSLVESPLALVNKNLSFNPMTNLDNRVMRTQREGVNWIRGINNALGTNLAGGSTGGFGQIANNKKFGLGDAFNVATVVAPEIMAPLGWAAKILTKPVASLATSRLEAIGVVGAKDIGLKALTSMGTKLGIGSMLSKAGNNPIQRTFRKFLPTEAQYNTAKQYQNDLLEWANTYAMPKAGPGWESAQRRYVQIVQSKKYRYISSQASNYEKMPKKLAAVEKYMALSLLGDPIRRGLEYLPLLRSPSQNVIGSDYSSKDFAFLESESTSSPEWLNTSFDFSDYKNKEKSIVLNNLSEVLAYHKNKLTIYDGLPSAAVLPKKALPIAAKAWGSALNLKTEVIRGKEYSTSLADNYDGIFQAAFRDTLPSDGLGLAVYPYIGGDGSMAHARPFRFYNNDYNNKPRMVSGMGFNWDRPLSGFHALMLGLDTALPGAISSIGSKVAELISRVPSLRPAAGFGSPMTPAIFGDSQDLALMQQLGYFTGMLSDPLGAYVQMVMHEMGHGFNLDHPHEYEVNRGKVGYNSIMDYESGFSNRKLLPGDIAGLKAMLGNVKDYSSINIPKFKTGGYIPGSPSMAIPALLHGGEYVVNADAVRNMGVRTMQSINQSKFRTPSSAPSYMGGGQTTNVSTVNINVDTFVGEEEWFKSMMKSYNVNVLPKQQKAAGMETRTFTSYNGINQGL